MGAELGVSNAASHWTAMAGARGWPLVKRRGFTAVRTDAAHRVLVEDRRDADPTELRAELLALLGRWESPQVCVEDPTLALDLADAGFEAALTMPVMVRPPDAVETLVPRRRDAPPADIRAEEAVSEEDLAEVERAVVEGFPIAQRLPWRRGEQFPACYDVVQGRRSWLARVDGRPAAACVTYDDGAAVGCYWVATRPEFRSRGAARVLLRTALAAHPGRPATLTSTLLGEPLYRRLGFTECALARWWQYPTSGASPAPFAARPDRARG